MKRLNEAQAECRDRLLQTMIPEHTECAAQEDVEQLADARMVAEIAALGEEFLLSSNFNRIEVEDLNRWLLRAAGEAIEPVGTAPNAAAVAETLIICGLEPESRRMDTIDGLMRGRELCLDREREG